jgi:anti-sigma factor RsiW
VNCDDVQDLIDGYVDGELDLVRSLEIEQHLQKCVTCKQEYKNRQILHSAISNGNFYYRAPASLQKRIQSSMKSSTPPLRGIAWRTLIVAAALTLLLIVAWNVVRFVMPAPTTNSLTQEVLASHIRSLMPGHLVDVSSSNQHTVKPWFNGKLDFSPPVVDLAQQGYPLIGGRLDYVRNKAVAVLVYQHGGHVINLFVWPEGQNEGQGTTSVTQQGYHILSWNRSGMSYWVVSDLEEAQLQEFVRLVQQNTP